MSPALILSATANALSFSNYAAFKDFVLGQKKMLTPDGDS
jgi:hypothetical protein